MNSGMPDKKQKIATNLKHFKKQLRMLFSHSITYQDALSKVKTLRKNQAFFRCAKCRLEYRKWNIEVDHIKPLSDCYEYAGGPFGVELAHYVTCLFDDKNLQVLCKSCHVTKTLQTNRTGKK